ncbi:hypothetical protein C7382_101146 [Porphyromonas loveana]|uniref:Uncharacterized protein n=1 Tax=Porphyromonas loveana TaxID=1884669 RepID=A0A2U1FSQ0_9PORP|nr:hypothetical protein C7382_101146 [Porphyromonas loveana]
MHSLSGMQEKQAKTMQNPSGMQLAEVAQMRGVCAERNVCTIT